MCHLAKQHGALLVLRRAEEAGAGRAVREQGVNVRKLKADLQRGGPTRGRKCPKTESRPPERWAGEVLEEVAPGGQQSRLLG